MVKQTPRWAKVDEYNAQIEALCKKRGWTYVDNSKLADGGKANIYIDDGIHLQPSFYPEWASNMIFSDDWSEQETDLKPVQSQKTIWRVPQVKDKQEEKISKKREIIWIEKKDYHLNQDRRLITWTKR